MRNRIALAVASAALLASTAGGVAQAQSARDYIFIVGSSTVYPFATVVAEQFGKTSSFKTPKIESTGSGGGLKLFCAGVGVEHPDVTNSSRRIKASEVEMCARNGVNEIVEVKIGYDGIAIANSRAAEQVSITRKEIYLALAAEVPDPSGMEKLVPNPYLTWNQINPTLPTAKIEVLGPPPTSGTRDAFVELVMEHGCEEFAFVDAMEGAAKKSACQQIREDGAYVEAGENDNLIVQKLDANPAALGIFGFSFLDQNTDKVQGSVIEGHPATFDQIADGNYPISRPLYFYLKKAHIGAIPGLKEYLAEFTSEKAWGPDGYLADKGMIPMPEPERQKFSSDAAGLANLKMASN